MEVQVSNTEFTLLKDTVWKLTSRVLLLEGFIKEQFGPMFWEFCEEQVNAAESGEESDSHELHDENELEENNEDDDDEIISQEIPETKVLTNMPQMIPIHSSVVLTANPNITITPTTTTTTTTSNNITSSSNTTLNAAVSVNKISKPIPPPPPLSCMKPIMKSTANSEINNSPVSTTNYQHKPRNFLPKSLAAKPKLFSAASASSTSSNNSNNGAGSISIKHDKVFKESSLEDFGAVNHNSDTSSEPPVRIIKTEAAQIQRKSPAMMVVSKQNMRPSFSNKNDTPNQQPQMLPKPIGNLTLKKPVFLSRNNFHESDVIQDYNVPYDSESEEDLEGIGYDGYLASDLVATSLAAPGEGPKRMKYSSFAAAAASSSGTSLNGTTPRQMRPNPCHTRCQNRCHDIWTDGDRMGVFETYWSIPTEEERREWVAQRIERVDMATKRTEFSNFRTCTFKYYLPHPDNPWVQVCKNFFLATIDEKRSYIEKIAQSVKGETEKLSAKDIPFRRRNQMRGGAAGVDFVGWMTGPDGVEPVEMDPDGDMGEGEERMMGMEMEEVAD